MLQCLYLSILIITRKLNTIFNLRVCIYLSPHGQVYEVKRHRVMRLIKFGMRLNSSLYKYKKKKSFLPSLLLFIIIFEIST